MDFALRIETLVSSPERSVMAPQQVTWRSYCGRSHHFCAAIRWSAVENGTRTVLSWTCLPCYGRLCKKRNLNQELQQDNWLGYSSPVQSFFIAEKACWPERQARTSDMQIECSWDDAEFRLDVNSYTINDRPVDPISKDSVGRSNTGSFKSDLYT